jgi:hypothetical protein
MSEKYCHEKGLTEVIDHRVVSQKWSGLLGDARKKRTTARKAAVGTGGGPEGATLDALSLLILSAAEENADLTSTTDCEPGFISQGEDNDDDNEPAVEQVREEENPTPSTSAGLRGGHDVPMLVSHPDNSFSLLDASIHGNHLLVGSQESLGHLSFGNDDNISLFRAQTLQHHRQQGPDDVLDAEDSPVQVTPPLSPSRQPEQQQYSPRQPTPQQQQQQQPPPQLPRLSAASPPSRPPAIVPPILVLTRGRGLAAAVAATMPRAAVSPPPHSASSAAAANRRQGILPALDAALPGAVAPAAGGGAVRRPRARRAQSAILGQYYENRAESEGTMLERISAARREAAEKEKAFNELLLSAKREDMAEAKAIQDIEKEKAAVDLEAAKTNKAKLEAENFTAQLRKSMTIAQYNQMLGTNIVIPDLPDF